MNRLLILTTIFLGLGDLAGAQEQSEPFRIAGAACVARPVLHCPDKDCPSDRVINQGPVVEMKTRRTYFLDYPCDMKPGEKVTFILSLHGGGSYGNWQRNYFPLMDYKDKRRLVIATPNAPTRAWSAADDDYLQNIVDFVVAQVGRENIKAFWLAGHSQGGMTSNRDPRERDVDSRDRDAVDPRDVFVEKLDLPRGPERELVRDRDREYTLRGSESRTLSLVGAFRVVPEHELRDHDGRPADPQTSKRRLRCESDGRSPVHTEAAAAVETGRRPTAAR